MSWWLERRQLNISATWISSDLIGEGQPSLVNGLLQRIRFVEQWHEVDAGRLFNVVNRYGFGVEGIVGCEPLLLPPDEAAKWKPHHGPWTDFMERVCGPET